MISIDLSQIQVKPNPLGRTVMVAPMSKVFIALRPNFFNFEDEHITLKYFDKAKLWEVMDAAMRLRKFVPTEVRINGFANWRGMGDSFYEVALIDPFANPRLFQEIRTPHVTIRKSGGPLSNATFDPQYFGESQIVDSLWVGKKSKGKFIWVPIENESIFDNAERNWKILGNL